LEGFVVGAVTIGSIADLLNISIAIQFVACIALASGIFVLVIMKETKKHHRLSCSRFISTVLSYRLSLIKLIFLSNYN
jgi:hypothetical protein